MDQLVNTSHHLQQVIGLPTREVGLQDEESLPELDTPSQPASPAGIIIIHNTVHCAIHNSCCR